MTEIGLAFIIGFMIGLVMRPKDKDLVEQKAIYDKKVAQVRTTYMIKNLISVSINGVCSEVSTDYRARLGC